MDHLSFQTGKTASEVNPRSLLMFPWLLGFLIPHASLHLPVGVPVVFPRLALPNSERPPEPWSNGGQILRRRQGRARVERFKAAAQAAAEAAERPGAGGQGWVGGGGGMPGGKQFFSTDSQKSMFF